MPVLFMAFVSFQAAAVNQSVTLNTGWNSLSLTVEDSNAFENLRDNNVERIFLWNSQEQRWMHYDFGRSVGDISGISPMRNYMVKAAASTSITFSGDTTSIQDTSLLDEKWNLITAVETETYSELILRFTEARPSLAISSLFINSGESWEVAEDESTIQSGAQLWINAASTGVSDPVNTTAANRVPITTNSSATTDEDVSLTSTLQASDEDDDQLVYAIVTQPTKGSITITDSTLGAYTYTPNTNESGSDSFTFKVNDGSVDSNAATVIITIHEPVSMQFQLSNALYLQVHDELIPQSTLSARTLVEKYLGRTFTSLQRKLYRRSGSSNMLAVKENGETIPAFETDYSVRVLYSAVDPTATYVYVVIDIDESSELVLEENCTLFQVEIATNIVRCVGEGLYLRSDLTEFRARFGEDRKPVQFDRRGHAYFAANHFSINTSGEAPLIEKEHNGSWKPMIYQYVPETDTLHPATNDAQSITYFIVLDYGELIYQGTNGITQETRLWLYRDRDSVVIGEHFPSYLSTDHHRTAYWMNGNTMNLVRSRDAGGVFRAYLPLEHTPQSTFLSDEGSLYGMNFSSNSVTVRSILPHMTNPVAQIQFAGQRRRTVPVRISERSVYYTDQEEVPYLGEVTVVKISSLVNGSTRTLFDDRRYDIYAWQLSGHKLYFSGVDLSSTSLVSGVIDTQKVKLGLSTEEYLSINSVESAVDAANEINDIEVLLPIRPTVDPGGSPEIEEITYSEDQRDVISMIFSKYMDYQSVEQELQLEAHDGAVEYLPIWFYRSLHLVPDVDGLGDQIQTTPLENNSLYQLTLGRGELNDDGDTVDPTLTSVMDSYGNGMVSDQSPPYLSWLTSDLSSTGFVQAPLQHRALYIPNNAGHQFELIQHDLFVPHESEISNYQPDQHSLYVQAHSSNYSQQDRLADLRVVVGEMVNFSITGVVLNEGATLQWDFGDNDTVKLGESVTGKQFAATGRYLLTLTLTENGVIRTITRMVEVVDVGDLSFITAPNAIVLKWEQETDNFPQHSIFITAPPSEQALDAVLEVTVP